MTLAAIKRQASLPHMQQGARHAMCCMTRQCCQPPTWCSHMTVLLPVLLLLLLLLLLHMQQ
jgi:hypothetical protein